VEQLSPDLTAFVRAALPEPPCRILEVGAGGGELAYRLRAAGYAVTAIDPAAEPGTGVERLSLLEVRGTFDAAVAVVSLHHIEPLEESCAHLASLLGPGQPLVIDEMDVDRLDERAVRWWLSQRHASVGSREHEHEDDAEDEDPLGGDSSAIVQHMRAHIHSLARVCGALRPYFELGQPVRGAYLHRWGLRSSLREVEVELIAEGLLPATGARLIATRSA
jgi:SAM-dependent methyltransferase